MKRVILKNVMSPGEALGLMIKELGISQREMARHLRISQPYLSDILRMKRGISPEMACRLARALGSTPQTWMTLQTNWQLSKVNQKKIEQIEKIAA